MGPLLFLVAVVAVTNGCEGIALLAVVGMTLVD